MKKIRHILFFAFGLLFINLSVVAQIDAKNYWEKFDVTDGLISNYITDVLIENDSTIWIGSDSGLTHYNGVTFTNYVINHPGLLYTTVSDLTLSQNKLFMIAGGLLTSFDGVNFTVYDTINGVSPVFIRDITTTSNDTLWICEWSGGVSKFDGANFTNYPSRFGFTIEADGLDRIYLATLAGTFQTGSVSMYENGVWSQPNPIGGDSLGGRRRLKRTADGELYVINGNNGNRDGDVIRIDYPLNYKKEHFRLNGIEPYQGTNRFKNFLKTSLFDKVGGKFWVGANLGTPTLIASGVDSLVEGYSMSLEYTTTTTLDVNNNIVAVGTLTDGLFVLKADTKPTGVGRERLSVNELVTDVTITDALFSDYFNGEANLEFPKNSGNHGVWTSNFIVAAKKSTDTNYSVYPQYIPNIKFAPGPISNTGGLLDQFIIKISQQEIILHQNNFNLPGYTMPNAIKDWPAFGDSTLGVAQDLAPFFDANNNGCYDPANGDYPIIKGDEAIYWINLHLIKA